MKSSIIKAAQSSGKLTVFFDSGIRTGSDIIKALALGAQAVLRKFSLLLEFFKNYCLFTNILEKNTSGPTVAVRFYNCRSSRG